MILEKNYKINIPIVNLRNSKSHLLSYTRDYEQETQLLLNESIKLLKIEKDWAFVECKEQKICFNKNYEGYQGWIEKKYLVEEREEKEFEEYIVIAKIASVKTLSKTYHLSFGTHLPLIKNIETDAYFLLPDQGIAQGSLKDFKSLKCSYSRSQLINLAKIFLGDPYLWGGRSSYQPEYQSSPSSIDCSGLVNLLFKINNLYLPRNAQDLYEFTHKICGKDLLPGDLIFISTQSKIDHVMLYLGSNKVIEATMITNNVRMIDLKERCDVLVENIDKESIQLNTIKLYFGKIFN